jgi:pSer/pThr/pTyr-binding forkhead associated (FHA) protein
VDAYLEPVNSASPLLTLKGQILSIGSGSGCDIVIDDPTVSRRHATLKKAEATWTLEDLGSTNGTWVNGRAIIRRLTPH